MFCEWSTPSPVIKQTERINKSHKVPTCYWLSHLQVACAYQRWDSELLQARDTALSDTLGPQLTLLTGDFSLAIYFFTAETLLHL